MTVIEIDVTESVLTADFWQAKAESCHEWHMLMYRFRRDAQRRQRCSPGVSNEYWSHMAEIDRAQQVFLAQYYFALACEQLALEGMSLDCLIMCTSNNVGLKILL